MGFVRDLGLTLDVDAPHHANVIGLPYEADVYDVAGARRASRLADHARYALPPKLKRAREIWDNFRSTFGNEPLWVGLSTDARFWQARMVDGTLKKLPVVIPNR